MQTNYSHFLKHPVFKEASEVCNKTGLHAYVVGGFVRDQLLERKRKKYDIDIVVLGSGIEFAEALARHLKLTAKITVFKNFGTAMLKFHDSDIEFVGARKESYNRNSRKPVVENGSLEDDQKRRDFTINAMAISLHPKNYGDFIDPFNGVADLTNKIIRTPLSPEETFSDDPLRMMRAVRFASQLYFDIEDNCMNAMRAQADRLNIVSMERVIEEFNKIILTNPPSRGVYLLEQAGLLTIFFPEFMSLKGTKTIEGKGHKEIFSHTLKVLDNISLKTDDLWLRWAALLHDIGKPATKKYYPNQGWTFYGHENIGADMVPSIFRRLKLPMNEKMKFVQKLVSLHLRPIALVQDIVSDSAVRRLLFDADADIDALMTLSEADVTTGNEDKYKHYLNNFILVRKKLIEIDEKDKIRNFQPPVSGEEIMNFLKLNPCREVGIIKNAIKEAVLEGQIPNEHDAAFEYMIEKAKELKLL